MQLVKCLMLLASVALVACGDENGSSDTQQTAPQIAANNNCVITYGWEPRKPYQFYENKAMRGIDVDLFAMAAKKANCGLDFVQKPWVELLTLVEQGKVDVLAGATPTDERKVYADFSVSYRAEAFALFIKSNSDFNGDNLNKFLSFGNRIGISTGYYYGDDVDDLMNHDQYSGSFIGSKTNEASFFNVEYGRVQGVLVDPIEGRYIIKRKGLSSKMKASEILIPADSVAYMFSKKSEKQEQLAQIKASIEQLVVANEPQKVIAKYQ